MNKKFRQYLVNQLVFKLFRMQLPFRVKSVRYLSIHPYCHKNQKRCLSFSCLPQLNSEYHLGEGKSANDDLLTHTEVIPKSSTECMVSFLERRRGTEWIRRPLSLGL